MALKTARPSRFFRLISGFWGSKGDHTKDRKQITNLEADFVFLLGCNVFCLDGGPKRLVTIN
jgi:hypothetical protein